jgi:AsmA protein
MTVIQTLAGVRSGPNTDIETLSAILKYSPEGSVVNDLKFVAQGVGELSGAGTISPANALDFKMQATVQTTRSAALSRTAVPFFVQGTAMDPVFKPDVRGLAKSQAETLLKGTAGQRAGEILGGLFGKKKK